MKTQDYTNRRFFESNTFNVLLIAKIVLIGLLAVGFVGPAQGQSMSSGQTIRTHSEKAAPTPTWHRTFETQARRLLQKESSSSVREVILQNIIVLASQKSGKVDLSRTVQPVLYVLETASEPQLRLMAVQALHSIRIEREKRILRGRIRSQVREVLRDESSAQVRRVASAYLKGNVSGETT